MLQRAPVRPTQLLCIYFSITAVTWRFISSTRLQLVAHHRSQQCSVDLLYHNGALHALPTWEASWILSLKNRINSSFKRFKRFGYIKINCIMTINDLNGRSDYELFKNVCSTSHSLHHRLPPYRTSDLRARGHPFQLSECATDLHKRSSIVRSLYEYV